MTLPVTEHLHPAATGLDTLPGPAVLGHLLAAQASALQAVSQALPQIEAAAALMAQALQADGRLVYAGAGSSALMAVADGLELGGTFGIPADRVLLLMAGGLPVDARMPGDTEDDADEGTRAAEILRAGDVVIAVTASGRTPYALAVAEAAQARGAQVIGIANAVGAKLFDHADVAICLPTPPEVIAGSTRMGAGTAQKAALNMMSTLMGIKLGQVHDGMMVGLVADNDKLRARAATMVARIAAVDELLAAQALVMGRGAVKPAVLIALGKAPDAALALLSETKGNLRAAIARSDKNGS
ncbi:MAG: N-acetylmuramic acid 6-phosphate etherase [Cypionkella sp.]|uniref:N-acetylmuramic acid 6-phosphate etherase n=1 Tax=Cypionkella sp. TaxID=2811411 RepID=UPI002ABC1637|nr:N-acetylmuramic acid 6-phosphate etherase [Cypionkella sp.]MDZ4312634.1 N-acetylmuramic acid 6-phosphate etherase [Cypionkella sp.]